MEQLTQKLKDGNMQVLDVPIPSMASGTILVRNHYSLISPGTEGSTVKTARSGYLAKAKERPQQVKQVVDTLFSQGITQTYRAVMKKLDAYSPLGYSCSGHVIGVAPDVKGVVTGDLVACGGLTASHAEIVSVPVNLCVTLRPDTDLKLAAYNTLGAIALQGVRQADLRLGETCAVIGMGLLGQLTALILRASGIRVVGIDINQNIIEIADKHCADLAISRDKPGINDSIMEFSGGLGCDAVIITAASSSLDPINFAGAIARKKGTIVVVGAVPTGFDREPHYYKKELQVRMSCSYGPGRYDPAYEEKGIDYPAAYVRWTEKRNMEAFQELIYTRRIDPAYLTTHVFKLQDAPEAYEMILEKKGNYIGILIEYDVKKQLEQRPIQLKPITNNQGKAVGIGFIGAGSYAQSHLLPNIPKNKDISLMGVMTSTGTGSRSVADRFGFDFCTGNYDDIFGNADINTIFIATRHDSHAGYVKKGLQAGKNIFVEKPLCLTENELDEITALYGSSSSPLRLMVGYNRRFSPLSLAMKDALGKGPMAMTYRINAGAIPADSWIQDPSVGGGRIIGEVCHFIDFFTFVNGSLPVSVDAAVMKSAAKTEDTIIISLSYQNGSIGTISYFANGDKSLPKERIEVFCNGVTAILDDFRLLSIFSKNRKHEKKLHIQDKGQKQEVSLFVDSVIKGEENIIPFPEIHSTSRTVFSVLKALKSGSRVLI